MLAHCVFCHFSDDATAKERHAVMRDLGTLCESLEGAVAFHYGPNLDFEGKSPNHSDGFIVMFTDREAHLRYERHPRHQELGGKLVDMCVGGADGIVVYDLDLLGQTG